MVLWDSFPCGIVLYIGCTKKSIYSIFFDIKARFRQDTFLNIIK